MNSKHGPIRGLKKLMSSLIAVVALLGFGVADAAAQTGGAGAPGGTTTTPAPTTPAPTTPAPTTGGVTVVQKATWYGPGLWGNKTACGMPLVPTVVGVAHKKLPCGTAVTFSHKGISVPATVIDRGPFRRGYQWDLTKLLAKRLGFLPVGAGLVTATIMPPGTTPAPVTPVAPTTPTATPSGI